VIIDTKLTKKVESSVDTGFISNSTAIVGVDINMNMKISIACMRILIRKLYFWSNAISLLKIHSFKRIKEIF